jgi:hypothetical protein
MGIAFERFLKINWFTRRVNLIFTSEEAVDGLRE